jgi:hypothetical protein
VARQIEDSVKSLVRSHYWPLSFEQTDIEVLWHGEGSIMLVIALPEPAGLILMQLAKLRIAPLLALGLLVQTQS